VSQLAILNFLSVSFGMVSRKGFNEGNIMMSPNHSTVIGRTSVSVRGFLTTLPSTASDAKVGS
jgi:hypothetical protein